MSMHPDGHAGDGHAGTRRSRKVGRELLTLQHHIRHHEIPRIGTLERRSQLLGDLRISHRSYTSEDCSPWLANLRDREGATSMSK